MSQSDSASQINKPIALSEQEEQRLQACLKERSKTEESAMGDLAALRRDRFDYRYNYITVGECEATKLKRDTYHATSRSMYDKYCSVASNGTDESTAEGDKGGEGDDGRADGASDVTVASSRNATATGSEAGAGKEV
ncbi:hypothetical protein IAU59_007080 [Kwoniella sp. CBS 9459]